MKHSIIYGVAALALSGFLTACNDDDVNIYTDPIIKEVVTGDAATTALTATINGHASDLSAMNVDSYTVGTVYSTTENPTAGGTFIAGTMGENGDFVTMDFGCVKNGYCSDMTRTVAVGHVTEEMKNVYDTVLRAQRAGIKAARAGVTGAQIDGAARQVISEAGYGDFFGHAFGHSLGLDIHEAPTAAPSAEDPMPDGAVISAEPGIYLPGRFGVRIEDVLILRAGGCENITQASKELIIL